VEKERGGVQEESCEEEIDLLLDKKRCRVTLRKVKNALERVWEKRKGKDRLGAMDIMGNFLKTNSGQETTASPTNSRSAGDIT